jgi:tRNA nucleotidyltransferase (CCA-adding enzyme)
MTEKDFANKIKMKGGVAYKVGGAVRDKYIGKPPKDNDYMVVGITLADFYDLFPDAEHVGKSFPVFLMKIEGNPCEIAFARKEKKVSAGYKGFNVIADETVTLHEDLIRRDTTMNALAFNLLTGDTIDLFNGVDDINNKLIRAVSDAFVEDPVRSLRVARQAAQFGFDVSQDTIEKMKLTKEELQQEPTERFFEEMLKALHTKKPSMFFEILNQADLLDVTFPQIHALIGVEQPIEWHPEGDAYVHTMEVLDRTANTTNDIVTRFSALAHDLGKAKTPKELYPKHKLHDLVGVTALNEWNDFMTLPNSFLRSGTFTIVNHMRFHKIKNPLKFVRLITEANKIPIGLEGFVKVTLADHNGEYSPNAEIAIDALQIALNTKPEIPTKLQGKAIGDFIAQKRAEQIAHLLQ